MKPADVAPLSLREGRRRAPGSRVLGRALVILACAAVPVALPAAASAQAPLPAPLTGEFVYADVASAIGTFDLQVECNPTGQSSFTFQASGLAFGPYPGTFTASGSGTFAGQTPLGFGVLGRAGFVSTFDETFTISSPTTATEITGTKHLLPAGEDPDNPSPSLGQGAGNCGEVDGAGLIGMERLIANVRSRYEARITNQAGTFIDRGTGTTYMIDQQVTIVASGQSGHTKNLQQSFTSTGPVQPPQPLLPTTKDDCRNGGYQRYGIFKNYGDCVSFVATGGMNEPGKNIPGSP